MPFGSGRNGVHASAPSYDQKPAGMTPITVCGRPPSRTACPTMSGSLSKWPAQTAWLSTTVDGAVSSSRTKARPSCGSTPKTRKKPAVTMMLRTNVDPLSPARLTPGVSRMPANAENARLWSRVSATVAGAWKGFGPGPTPYATTLKMRSGSGKGRGRTNTALITPTMTVAAPRPRPRTTTAAIVKPRSLASVRAPIRRSCQRSEKSRRQRRCRSQPRSMPTHAALTRP